MFYFCFWSLGTEKGQKIHLETWLIYLLLITYTFYKISSFFKVRIRTLLNDGQFRIVVDGLLLLSLKKDKISEIKVCLDIGIVLLSENLFSSLFLNSMHSNFQLPSWSNFVYFQLCNAPRNVCLFVYNGDPIYMCIYIFSWPLMWNLKSFVIVIADESLSKCDTGVFLNSLHHIITATRFPLKYS